MFNLVVKSKLKLCFYKIYTTQTMQIKDVTQYLESIAPLVYQEKYDNAGLIIGNGETKLSRILVCLDVTEKILQEAIDAHCELIVSHHPIIFQPLKKINGKNFVERIIIKAIKNDVALYAIHTNLDNVLNNGVNQTLAKKLGLNNIRILEPKSDLLHKLTTFAPIDYKEKILAALHQAGAGNIGDYKNCSFSIIGEGVFTPQGDANPFIGAKDTLEKVEEVRIEVIMPTHLSTNVVRALKLSHPYETVSYYLSALKNTFDEVGSGVIGTIEPTLGEAFLDKIKSLTQAEYIKHTAILENKIKTVALCGGSGRFLLESAIAAGAEIFISSDFKYHDYFEADGKILIADIGHYESEQHTIAALQNLISKQFANLFVKSTENNTNPVRFL